MKKRTIEHHLDGLIALLLFGVFAACVLTVLLTGANAYQRLTERDQSAFNRRTCAQYVASRVRQSDQADLVSVSDFGGESALVLLDPGGDYVTRVYCHEGYLMELYTDVLSDMAPEDGEQILSLRALDFTLEDGLLTAVIENEDGGIEELRLSLRAGKGEFSS